MTDTAAGTQRLTDPIMALTATARHREGHRELATFLIDLSPSDMQRRLGDALSVYVDAMRYPRGTEDQRASMWLEHTRRRGWKAVAAVEAASPTADLAAAPMLGVAYGYCGAPTNGGSSRWYRACTGWARTPRRSPS